MGKMHLRFMLIYFALENLIPRDKFRSSENTPQDTVCNAIDITGTPVLLGEGKSRYCDCNKRCITISRKNDIK